VHVGAGQAGGGEHRELGSAEARATGEQQVALATVEAACVDVGKGLDARLGVDLGPAVGRGDEFDGDHAITARRQHRARHHLEAGIRRRERGGALPGGLRAADAEAPLARPPGLAREGDAVHRHAVEWRLVALGAHRLRQHRARQRGERAGLDRQHAHAGADQRLGFGGSGKRRHRTRGLAPTSSTCP